VIATTLSGALMGMAGAPLPYYVTYLDPASSFNLSYAVNSVAMPVIGGMTSVPGMVVAALLIGIVESITATFYGPSWAPAVAFGFLLIALAVRPAGLAGR